MNTNSRSLFRKLKEWRVLHVEHLLVCCVMVLLLGLGALVTLNLSIFNPLARALSDFTMTDVYYDIQQSGDKELSSDIVLVDVTSLRSRDEIAAVIEAVNACEPRVLSIDLMFERPSANSMDDANLVAALEAGRQRAVMACKLTDFAPAEEAFHGTLLSFVSEFCDLDYGYCNVYQKHTGGIVREFTLSQNVAGGQAVFSMPYLAACRYSGQTPRKDGINVRPIVYSNTDFPVVMPADIASHAELLRDKLVMLGTMSEEADMHITPIGKMSGLKIQAYSVLSCLSHRQVVRMPLAWSIVLAFLLCYLSAFVGYRLIKWSPGLYTLWLKLYYLLVVSLLVWLAFVMFVRYGYNIPLAIPLLSLALLETARVIYIWAVRGLQKKARFKFVNKSIYAIQV